MGADLYIQALQDTPEKQAIRARMDELQTAVAGMTDEQHDEFATLYDSLYSPDCYFRDSYNDSSVLWQLGLSWWQDVGAMVDEETGILSPEKCNELADMVAARELRLERRDWEHPMRETMVAIDDTEEIAYFTEKKERLITFLRSGAANGGIRCSI